ncbi:hypothetical protein NITMOv2_3341 [Nitrospira moscoviensis]|uniref:Apea-like HEPN domain-containing protein n=1 Tax=Nitrospira moscoviensis TaxID=42253 RepID=A0A0K2GFV4_NITMO|nr:hypothetical protein NITMOv2_3341 [Nitrospira moscoviensis]
MHRALDKVRSQALCDRLHRARSWINAANALPVEQKHAQFTFFYIAFNALYGHRRYEGSREENAKDREEFLKRIRTLRDYERRAGQDCLRGVLGKCQDQCGKLILNYFLRDTYWRKERTSKELQRDFSLQRRLADQEYAKGCYDLQLDLILKRLNVLRNQVFHGCVTYGPGSKGLSSLMDGLTVIRELVPAFYALMDKYGQHLNWPAIPYPRVGSDAHPTVDEWE